MQRQEIVNTVYELIAKVNQIFGSNIAVPEIVFYRLGEDTGLFPKSATKYNGMAAYNCEWIAFNLDVAEKYPDQFFITISHEVSHIVQYLLFPNAKIAHGSEFKRICRLLGGTGESKGKYAISPVDPTKYVEYKCGCRSHFVTKIRHNKMIRGTMDYSCKYCDNLIMRA